MESLATSIHLVYHKVFPFYSLYVLLLCSNVGSNIRRIMEMEPIQLFMKNGSSRRWMVTWEIHVAWTFKGLYYIARGIVTKIVSQHPVLILVNVLEVSGAY